MGAVSQARHCHVSIHAPAKGATRRMSGTHASVVVSIHAPAKGATSCRVALGLVLGVWFHAPGMGATSQGRHV